MEESLFKKIIDEVSTESFKKKHTVKRLEVGENGDSFLNKDFVEILRYAKQKLPDVIINFNTNFQNFTKDKAEVIGYDKLVDLIMENKVANYV